MEFELPEDVKMLRDTIRQFVKDELMPLEKVMMEVELVAVENKRSWFVFEVEQTRRSLGGIFRIFLWKNIL